MTKPPLSVKQEEFLRSGDKRINLLSGSVRSGKTWISLLKWALFIGCMPPHYEFIMCGKTVSSLKRNCLNLLADLVGGSFSFSLSQKCGELFGRRVWFEGANDERSESKIRGMTLGGAYCDELTLFPRGFYMMLLSRLSLPGARLFATTNPDSPDHWVKTEIIDNAEIQAQTALWHFTLDDNDFLDKQYAEDLKREYTGVFYSRFILGEWVRAEGLIYDMFDESVHVVPPEERPYERFFVSCDYGTQNPTVFSLWGLFDGVWYLVREYHYSGREKNRQKTDAQFADDYLSFAGDNPVAAVIIDPSAASFTAELRRRGVSVKRASNTVLDGIRLTASLLQSGKIRICSCCTETIREFRLYAWDTNSPGGDRPLKDNDHHMDSIRYFCQTILSGRGQIHFA